MPEESNEEEKKKKLNFDFRIIIVGIAIVFLAAGIAFIVATMVVSPPGEANGNGAEQTVVELGPTYHLEEFTVNLAESGGRRFLRTQIILELDGNRGLRREIDDKLPIIRHNFILVMSEKTIEEIETAAGKNELKKELVNTINPLLANGEVENIYFNTFVFQ
ncbi:flagellar FliL protein [Desulfitispora alkaliphila]|uniref:flagellar basal body-associated FliL family protein n=1 Tax=Desulfitispora alkaliphila TaxID=622674 RepID=UPI003D1EE3A9